jgi:hypothetical protein
MTIFRVRTTAIGILLYPRKLRILVFSTLDTLVGRYCLPNGLQRRCSLGLGQHTHLSKKSRQIKHHAIRFHLGSHNPCSCYCPVSHTNWPLWLCAGPIDLQRIFIRKLLFLVSSSQQLQIVGDSHWLGSASVVTPPSIAEMAVKPVMEPALFRILAELRTPATDPAEVQKAIHA